METIFSHEPLVEYIRDRHNQKVGVVVACKFEGSNDIIIGHSKVNISRGDWFDKALGLNIALDRAVRGSRVPVPSSSVIMVNKMRERAIKYFKVTVKEVFVGGLLRTT